MTDFEWLQQLQKDKEEHDKRIAELKKKVILQEPEKDIVGTFWTHPFRDDS